MKTKKHDKSLGKNGKPSDGSIRLARLPCLELLCTNILSDIANNGPSTRGVVPKTTLKDVV